MAFKWETTDEHETMAIAEKLGQIVEPKDIILLEWDLGAGKTTFTKGLALGMGITQIVKSPTYTLIREYTKGRLPLYHLDVYRLEESGGSELGLEEYFYGDGVSVIEWSTFIEDELPEDYLKVEISRTGEYLQNRFFQVEAVGLRYEKRLAAWEDLVNEIRKD